VAPDEKYPNMYRIHWPDRPPSDMVNLTRAKDAAMMWVSRQHSKTLGALDLKWKASKTPPGGARSA